MKTVIVLFYALVASFLLHAEEPNRDRLIADARQALLDKQISLPGDVRAEVHRQYKYIFVEFHDANEPAILARLYFDTQGNRYPLIDEAITNQRESVPPIVQTGDLSKLSKETLWDKVQDLASKEVPDNFLLFHVTSEFLMRYPDDPRRWEAEYHWFQYTPFMDEVLLKRFFSEIEAAPDASAGLKKTVAEWAVVFSMTPEQHAAMQSKMEAERVKKRSEELAPTTRAKVGENAPDFAGETLSGEKVSLSGEKGKVVLVNFFATWCWPCVKEMPHLEKEVFQKYKDRKDFKLIVISVDQEVAELEKFRKEKGLSFVIVPDPKQEIYGRYAESYIPRNFIIGKDGKVKLASIGYAESYFSEIVQMIQSELEK